MVFNAPFNNISIILRWSVLLVEETGEPEKTTDLCIKVKVISLNGFIPPYFCFYPKTYLRFPSTPVFFFLFLRNTIKWFILLYFCVSPKKGRRFPFAIIISWRLCCCRGWKFVLVNNLSFYSTPSQIKWHSYCERIRTAFLFIPPPHK